MGVIACIMDDMIISQFCIVSLTNMAKIAVIQGLKFIVTIKTKMA